MTLNKGLICNTEHNNTAIMLSVSFLFIVILNVIMMNVVMLIVVARFSKFNRFVFNKRHPRVLNQIFYGNELKRQY
jgi:hypothetical protein